METVVQRRRKETKISLILLDWGVRESFHSLHYLNNQDFPRERYEIIWIEFYDRKPKELLDALAGRGGERDFTIDTWVVLGYPSSVYYHKHFMYNVGIILASGEICVICDSDAMYSPTFLKSIWEAFEQNEDIVLHLDQARSSNRAFYPFNYPSIEEVLNSEGMINWNGKTTTGVTDTYDFIHSVNYGACMCARRSDLIAIGGADEHLDYLGYICGPYEMTWRLVNAGKREVWSNTEFTYHTWHPGAFGARNYGGPHEGRNISSRALQARSTGRVLPWVENRAIHKLRLGRTEPVESLLKELASEDRSAWEHPERYMQLLRPVQLAEPGYLGFNIVLYEETYYGIRQEAGAFDPQLADAGAYDEIKGSDVEEVKKLIRKKVEKEGGGGVVQPEKAASGAKETTASREQAAASESTWPGAYPSVLLVAGAEYRGFNVIQCGDGFFAIEQGGGPFDPEKVARRRYPIVYWASTVEELRSKLRLEPATRLGRWAMRPVCGGVLRNLARRLRDPFGTLSLYRALEAEKAALVARSLKRKD